MKTIYINGVGEYTDNIKKNVEGMGFTPSNIVDGNIIHKFSLVEQSDAMYLSTGWTKLTNNILEQKIATVLNKEIYQQEDFNFMDMLDVAILDVFDMGLDMIVKYDKRSKTTNIRTMYVGLARQKGVSMSLVSDKIQRHTTEIMHLEKKHEDFYKYDPEYRRKFHRLEDYIEMVALREIVTIKIMKDDRNRK